MRALLAVLALAASPPVTRDVLPVMVQPPGAHATSSVEFAWSGGPPRPLAPRLAVLTRPPRLDDALPATALPLVQHLPGARPAASRLLVARGHLRIYAFPGSRGSVCIYRTPGSATCVSQLLHGAMPSIDARQDVWGLADNSAVRVDVVVPGHVLHARVARNAFYVALPRGVVTPRRLVVHDRGGTRHVYAIRACRVGDVRTQVPVNVPLSTPGC